MNHDYIALKIHETRIDDLRTEARHDRVVREVLRARRVLARLTTPAPVLAFRGDVSDRPEAARSEGRPAA